MLIKNNSKVLFQGDSITDCGRSKENLSDLGAGYPMITAALFGALHPDIKVEFINRGISGNRVKDLAARWGRDCIDLKPDIVSILIGVNDCWRRYDRNDPTSAEQFEEKYREILSAVKSETPADIIILEPFVLPYPEDRAKWREDIDPKIDAARRLAREFAAEYIPLDGIFNSYSVKKHPSFWAADGVHPTKSGHALIAKQWLCAAGAWL